MKAFYPKSTDKIFHISSKGESYRLDTFDSLINLREKLSTLQDFQVIDISVNNEEDKLVKFIELAHTPELINALKNGEQISAYNQSGVLHQPSIYDYILDSALCIREALSESLATGKSISLTGGGHHAESNRSLGFGLINCIALSALEAVSRNLKVATLDLDVHYGNGIYEILKDQVNVFCTGIWNKMIPKWKYLESEGNIYHIKAETKKQYFNALNRVIEKIGEFEPDLIVYHLGLDVLETDRMGGIKGFNEDDLLTRESIVSEYIKDSGNRLLIFRGGSYIDYSQSPDNIAKQKKRIVDLQSAALKIHNG